MKIYVKPKVEVQKLGQQDILTSSAEIGIRLPEIKFTDVIKQKDLNTDNINSIQSQKVE